MNARDRLIVGLDIPTIAEAENMVATLGDSVSFYKIGYQLVFAGGLEFARDLAKDGKQVFLDMKLLDIDNTVAKGVENIAKMGMTMLTLHAYPKAMQAAVEAAKGSDLCLLGVTVLTSMDAEDLIDAAITRRRENSSPGAPNRPRPRAWAASSARRKNPLWFAPFSAPTWRSSPPASARSAPMPATRSVSSPPAMH